MTSIDVEALRRRRREPTSYVGSQVEGLSEVWRRRRADNRNSILSGTFSQCSSRRSGVRLRAPINSLRRTRDQRRHWRQLQPCPCNSCPDIPDTCGRTTRLGINYYQILVFQWHSTSSQFKWLTSENAAIVSLRGAKCVSYGNAWSTVHIARTGLNWTSRPSYTKRI